MNYGDFSIYHGKDHCLVTHARGSKGISFLDDKKARQRQALNRCVENLYKYRFLKADEIINAFFTRTKIQRICQEDEEMIVIKNIELIETPHDWYEYVKYEAPELLYHPDGIDEIMASESIKKSIVKGERFCKMENGEIKEWIIGVSDEAAEILGLQYETWNNKDKELMEVRKLYHESLKKYRECSDSLNKYRAWIKISILKKIYLILFNCVGFEVIKP